MEWIQDILQTAGPLAGLWLGAWLTRSHAHEQWERQEAKEAKETLREMYVTWLVSRRRMWHSTSDPVEWKALQETEKRLELMDSDEQSIRLLKAVAESIPEDLLDADIPDEGFEPFETAMDRLTKHLRKRFAV